MTTRTTSPRTATIMVLLAAALWGTTGLFVRAAAMAPQTLAFFRMLVPTVVIGGWFLLRRHRIPREGLAIRLTASAINAVRMYLFFYAFTEVSVAVATIVLYSWPLFALLFARPVLGEPITRRQVVVILIGFAGVPILAFGGGEAGGASQTGVDLLGVAAMLTSAALHALAVTLLKRARSGASQFETTLFQNLIGAIAFGVLFLLGSARPALPQIGWAVGLGATTGLVGFTLFFVALHRMPTSLASNLAYFEVIVAATLGTLFLGEPLTVGTVVGATLVGVSVVLANTARPVPRPAAR